MINQANVVIAFGGNWNKEVNSNQFQGAIQEVLYAIYKEKQVVLLGGFGGAISMFIQDVNDMQNVRFTSKLKIFNNCYDIELTTSKINKWLLDNKNRMNQYENSRNLFEIIRLINS